MLDPECPLTHLLTALSKIAKGIVGSAVSHVGVLGGRGVNALRRGGRDQKTGAVVLLFLRRLPRTGLVPYATRNFSSRKRTKLAKDAHLLATLLFISLSQG
jgi:hypothetical protein